MNLQAQTIAVIDDDPRVLESLVNLLASYGYSAQSYISAEQFLQAGGPGKCNCVIADVEMPQMSGLGLLEHLKGNDCNVPMILITGKPSVRSEDFYRERGAIGFFRKPVDGDTLVELICTVCMRPNPEVS